MIIIFMIIIIIMTIILELLLRSNYCRNALQLDYGYGACVRKNCRFLIRSFHLQNGLHSSWQWPMAIHTTIQNVSAQKTRTRERKKNGYRKYLSSEQLFANTESGQL